MISRQLQDGRFMTQWTMPRYGEPSDHGAAWAFTASTGGATPAAINFTFAPTNAPVGLGARIFLKVTAPTRAYLARGVPGWASVPNTVWKPTNPIINMNQTVPTLAVNTRVAYNSITGVTYTSQQMGDPSITCQLGYVGGQITTMTTSSNPQVYNPITSEQVVIPPTFVAGEYWNDAVAAVTSIITTIQLSISAHGVVTIPIFLDEDVQLPTNTIVLVEGYLDGDVRQTSFSSTSTYTVWNGASQLGVPLVQTPKLTTYPTFAASGALSNPSTVLLAANKTKLMPLENLTCANGFEYAGILDGYQLYMPGNAEASIPNAGRTVWQFVKRGGGDLIGGISAWATIVGNWYSANRITPMLTQTIATYSSTTSESGATTASGSTTTSTATPSSTTAVPIVTSSTSPGVAPVTSVTTTDPYSETNSASTSTGTGTFTGTGTISQTGTETGTTSTTVVNPAVTDAQFSFRLNFASLFTVLADLQSVNAVTGAVIATYPAERTLLAFNCAPAGSNRLVLVITNADGSYTSIDMDSTNLASGMTIMRRQRADTIRTNRGISSPIGKGSV